MSQATDIVLYHPNWQLSDYASMEQVMRLSGSDKCIELHGTLEEDCSWHLYQENDIDPFPDEESIGEDVDNHEILQHLIPDRFLRVQYGNCPITEIVRNTIIEEIPYDVRGKFVPLEFSLIIGNHDLISTYDYPEIRLISRTALSIHFSGYGIPSDPETFQEMVFGTTSMLAFRRDLESIVGPVFDDCIWYL